MGSIWAWQGLQDGFVECSSRRSRTVALAGSSRGSNRGHRVRGWRQVLAQQVLQHVRAPVDRVAVLVVGQHGHQRPAGQQARVAGRVQRHPLGAGAGRHAESRSGPPAGRSRSCAATSAASAGWSPGSQNESSRKRSISARMSIRSGGVNSGNRSGSLSRSSSRYSHSQRRCRARTRSRARGSAARRSACRAICSGLSSCPASAAAVSSASGSVPQKWNDRRAAVSQGRQAQEALAVAPGLADLQPVQELGRLQHRQQDRAQALGLAVGGPGPVGRLQDRHLLGQQRPPVGPGGEAGDQPPGARLPGVTAGQRLQAAAGDQVLGDGRRQAEVGLAGHRRDRRQGVAPLPELAGQHLGGARVRVAGQVASDVVVFVVAQPAQHPGARVVGRAAGGRGGRAGVRPGRGGWGRRSR